MAVSTLEHMFRGGLFDHIGGGFCRYSTDAKWLAPHFEKMLYDNALLAMAYTEAFHQTCRPVFRSIACRTLNYVLRELSDPEGGLYCGQDADSDGVEGMYYLLTPEDVFSALDEDTARRFCQRFDVTSQGNFEGKSIPNLIGASDWEAEPSWGKAARERLYEYRRKGRPLATDDKVLTGWNGLMIAALARAGFLFDEPRYLEAATRAVTFIRDHLTDETGCLLARWRAGDAAHAGKLDDYAFYVWGLLELYGATFQTDYLSEACRMTEILLDGFFDSEWGGFYPYSDQGEQLITRTKEVYDGAMPSGNAVAALVLSRLARLTENERFREAKELGCAAIITHHPLMFHAVQRITDETREGELILQLAASGLSHIAAHTNLDRAPGGVNDTLYETGSQLNLSGVISGHDITCEAALTKLMYLFGLGLSHEEVKKYMNCAICGEVSL